MSEASPGLSGVPSVAQLSWALDLSGHVWDVLTSSLPWPVRDNLLQHCWYPAPDYSIAGTQQT